MRRPDDPAARAAAVRPSSLPPLMFGVLLVFSILIGGSEVGVFLVPFQVINAVIGATLVAWWIVLLRRGTDPVDLLTVGALLAFVIACAAGLYTRQSFDAAVAALSWAAGFGIGRRFLADPRYRLLCLRLLALCGLVLAIGFAFFWGPIWVEWVRLAVEVPPFDLNLPPHIYRHYYVVAMLLTALLPASIYLLRDPLLRFPAALTLLLTAVLVVVSGSRTVWLAVVVTGLAALALSRPSRRAVLVGAGAAAAIAILALASGAADAAADRLLAGGTVTYRMDIWRESLDIWLTRPLTGIGPGSIGIGLTLSDLPDRYFFFNRHADNAYVQLAAEAGLVGLLGGGLAIAGIVRGRRWDLAGARTALLGLVVLGVMSLTNNPTDSPTLVAVILAYAALLAPFERSIQASTRSRRTVVRAATWGAAAVVALAVALVNAAAVVQMGSRQDVAAGRWSEAARQLEIASALDPGLALYHRERGVLLLGSEPAESVRELRRTTELNPADVAALRALAAAEAASRDPEGAVAAAQQATRTRPLAAESWLVLAMVAQGDESLSAMAEAIRLAPWLPGSSDWPEELSDPDAIAAGLQEAGSGSLTAPIPRDTLSLAWLNGVTGGGRPAPDSASLAALTRVLECDLAGAELAFEALGPRWANESAGIVGRIMLARLTGDQGIESLSSLASLSQPELGAAARGLTGAYSALTDPRADPQLYRRHSIGPFAGPMVLPRTTDALGAWMVEPREAAARGAPGSPIASCQ